MPDSAYRVARSIARTLSEQHNLVVPFDLELLIKPFADVREASLPVAGDCLVLHGSEAGSQPTILLDARLNETPDRKRFVLAHALGHIMLGWHPLGEPCDVSHPPRELPATRHDLMEGEASAFARELLAPQQWIAQLGGFDQPTTLALHVAARAGIPIMSAIRAVTPHLVRGALWVVVDQWGRVVDAGRSPGTDIALPELGMELESAAYVRHAAERHRTETPDGDALHLWQFSLDRLAPNALPRDAAVRRIMQRLHDAHVPTLSVDELIARLDGAAGWANGQIESPSLEEMTAVLGSRVRSLEEFAAFEGDPTMDDLVSAKARELVARRMSR